MAFFTGTTQIAQNLASRTVFGERSIEWKRDLLFPSFLVFNCSSSPARRTVPPSCSCLYNCQWLCTSPSPIRLRLIARTDAIAVFSLSGETNHIRNQKALTLLYITILNLEFFLVLLQWRAPLLLLRYAHGWWPRACRRRAIESIR